MFEYNTTELINELNDYKIALLNIKKLCMCNNPNKSYNTLKEILNLIKDERL